MNTSKDAPRRAKHPCQVAGCPNLTERGAYCAEHAPRIEREASRSYERYRRDKRTHGARYGSEWRKIRARILTLKPLCERCRERGILTRATEVHHIIPLSEGGTNADENLMALCKPCHSRYTMTATNKGRG